MTSTYAVQVECSSGGKDNAAYDAVLDALDEKVVDSIVRDDGSAVFWLEWEPKAEHYTDDKGKVVVPDDAATTWNSAKDSIEHIRSTFAGYGVLVGELRVGEHEVGSRKRKAKSDS